MLARLLWSGTSLLYPIRLPFAHLTKIRSDAHCSNSQQSGDRTGAWMFEATTSLIQRCRLLIIAHISSGEVEELPQASPWGTQKASFAFGLCHSK